MASDCPVRLSCKQDDVNGVGVNGKQLGVTPFSLSSQQVPLVRETQNNLPTTHSGGLMFGDVESTRDSIEHWRR